MDKTLPPSTTMTTGPSSPSNTMNTDETKDSTNTSEFSQRYRKLWEQCQQSQLAYQQYQQQLLLQQQQQQCQWLQPFYIGMPVVDQSVGSNERGLLGSHPQEQNMVSETSKLSNNLENYDAFTSFLQNDNSPFSPWSWNPNAPMVDNSNPTRFDLQPGSFFVNEVLDMKPRPPPKE